MLKILEKQEQILTKDSNRKIFTIVDELTQTKQALNELLVEKI